MNSIPRMAEFACDDKSVRLEDSIVELEYQGKCFLINADDLWWWIDKLTAIKKLKEHGVET